jgi:hypothetical protein
VLDDLGKSFMAGDPLLGGGFCHRELAAFDDGLRDQRMGRAA